MVATPSPSTATALRVRPVEIRVGCHACGQGITLPNVLAVRWMASHRMPGVLAVLLDVDGYRLWWVLRG